MAYYIRRVSGNKITEGTISVMISEVKKERKEDTLSKEGYEEVVRQINASEEMGSVYEVIEQ